MPYQDIQHSLYTGNDAGLTAAVGKMATWSLSDLSNGLKTVAVPPIAGFETAHG